MFAVVVFVVVVFELRTEEKVLADFFDVVGRGSNHCSQMRSVRKRLLADDFETCRFRKVEFCECFEIHARFCGNLAHRARCALISEFVGNDEFAHRFVGNLIDADRAVRFERKSVFKHDFRIVRTESCKAFLLVVGVVEHPLDVAFFAHAVNGCGV